jgi:hypothetical protein
MRFLLSLVLLFAALPIAKAHLQLERDYQIAWCTGKVEFVLPDKTRIDCVTADYAIEIDFADHWNQSVGQAQFYTRYYNELLGRENVLHWVLPGIGLIMETVGDCKYLERLRSSTDIQIFQIGPFANKCEGQ